jgi:magnesium chelatase family protein
VEAVVVTVEVDLSVGIGIHLVGLPDSAVRESLLRVITALTSYGFRIPGRKIVVNLAPADIRKEGSAYDLAIALGMLAASEQVSLVDCDKFLIMGELALDGRLRAVNGVLPVALKARDEGFGGCIFPAESAQEAAEVDGLAVYGVSSLAEAIEVLTRREECDHLRVRRQVSSSVFRPSGNDFRQVRGQQLAKRGMEIAAAGGHNIILVGAPGSGKSLMASCLPSILPPMTREEAIETGKIYSVAGRGARMNGGLMQERPFRAPHHSASLVSMIGGGQNAAPGEISLAHNGVLYC